MRLPVLSLALPLLPSVAANTEKVIFTGPSTQTVPVDSPTLDDLQLPKLSPHHWALRTHLSASFPSTASRYGTSSWLLLHGLQEGQRYEVRICWAATVCYTLFPPSVAYQLAAGSNLKQEPTDFRLDTYDLPTVFSTPELISSLSQYSESEQPDPITLEEHTPSIFSMLQASNHTENQKISTLFLRVQAAADYYTTTTTLMANVPPVHVDIILDPYLLNILPRSLVPTVGYILLLAIGSWYLSNYISTWLRDLRDGIGSPKKKSM